MLHNKFISRVAVLSAFFLTTAFAAPETPIGYWKTIDDVTGKPKSVVQIWETSDNTLMGKVIRIFPSPGKTEGELCTACKGENLNQPIVGMVILSGLQRQEEHWKSGKILDPENGKTYNCSLRVANSGNQLDVRGYIGLPLLGRSQVWQRVDIMDDNKG